MFELIGVGDIKEVYKEILRTIYENHISLVSERSQEYKECVEPIVVELRNPLICPTVDFLPEEILNYFPSKFVEEYSINMASCEEEEGDWDYTYGGRLAIDNQLVECIKKLIVVPDTRQATLTFRLPSDIYMEHPPCLTTISMFIREDKLTTYTTIRSNDMVYGWPIDLIGLLYTSTRVAFEVGVELDSISTISLSAHYYSRDEEFVRMVIGE